MDQTVWPSDSIDDPLEMSIASVIKNNTMADAERTKEPQYEQVVNECETKSRCLGEEVKLLREQGLTFAQIAIELQQPLSTCYTALRSLRLPKEYSDSFKNAVRRRKCSGLSSSANRRWSDNAVTSSSNNASEDGFRMDEQNSNGADYSTRAASAGFDDGIVPKEEPNWVSQQIEWNDGQRLDDSSADLSSTTQRVLQMVNKSITQKEINFEETIPSVGPEYVASDSDVSVEADSVNETTTKQSNTSRVGDGKACGKLLPADLLPFVKLRHNVGGVQFSCKLCSAKFAQFETQTISNHIRKFHAASWTSGQPHDENNTSQCREATTTSADDHLVTVNAPSRLRQLCDHPTGNVSEGVAPMFTTSGNLHVRNRSSDRVSPAWEFVVPGSGPDRHKCLLCNTEIKSFGVSNIVQHMRRYHPGVLQEAEVLVSGAGQTTKRMRLSTNSKPVNSSTLVVTHKSDSEGEKTRQAVVIHTEPVIHHEVAQVAQEISDGSSMQDGQMVTPTVVATSPTSSLCTTPPIANVPVLRVPISGTPQPSAVISGSHEALAAIQGIKNKLAWATEQLSTTADPNEIISLMNVVSSGLAVLEKYGSIN